MKILKLDIKNYRNLGGVTINLHPEINFIVGENNLGKSNLLDLLNILFNRNNFSESDFFDIESGISISFSLQLSDIEQGFFEDLFDPDSRSNINIEAIQEAPDESIRFIHKESEISISSSVVKCVNYIHYDSLRNPFSELSFTKNRGVGKFLNHIIIKYLQADELQDSDFFVLDNIDEFIFSVNQSLQKIRSFREFSVQAVREENKESLLANLVLLADNNNRPLGELGYGVQFSIIIALSIFERLLSLSKQRLDRSILEDTSCSKKCIPILIGLDEPEIHLHPYAQRSLIKYLARIVSNNEPDFGSLLAEIFQVDKLLGQIIVVSHSPNLLLNDYRQYLRFCKDKNNSLVVKSGSDISLDPATEKQLLKNLPYIKESFFSKVVIFVEGDSELGALPIFFKRLDLDPDDLGVSIIQAGSADSIPPLMRLLNEFYIQNIGLMDSDKRDDYGDNSDLFFTQGIDFEEDIYENFYIPDYAKYLENEFPNERRANFFIGKARIFGISLDPHGLMSDQLRELSSDKIQEIKINSKQDIINKLRRSKSILTGRDLGLHVTEIPQIYLDLIERTVELSRNAN